MTEHQLAATFVELAAAPEEHDRLPAFLGRFAGSCARLLGARTAVVLLTGREHEPAVAGALDPRLAALELEAAVRGEGPGALCVRQGRAVAEVGLTGAVARHRWPYYAPRAEQLGVHKAAAFPLLYGTERLGALILLRDTQPPPDAGTAALAQLLADAAALSLWRVRELTASRTLADQLQHALISRVLIEQAKGMLAARLSLPIDQSFQLLRDHARSHRRSLREVAREVIEGTLTIPLK
ncbi:ANTAR domain-containing protein [Streptomyces polyrhachis]|uniref:ANTAR domain-containing protein n=1 Tax=Streptomyces polyrhachis TaxID=1282885 RepID=A0ABW2GE42_9ACTN